MTDESNSKPRADKSEDLQRVREILFGAEQHRTSERFASLEQRLDRQIELLHAEAKATQQRLEEQLARVRSDAEKQRAQLAAEIERQLADLRDGKLDRGDLAEMLGGMLSRLSTSAKQVSG